MKYSAGFKASIIRKTQDGSGKSVYQLSQETGISAQTITSWIEKHKSGILSLDAGDNLTPSQRSPGEKLSLLLESRTVNEDKKGEWLRQQGMHSEHLSLWEQELTTIMNDKQSSLRKENADLKAENKRLKKENKRQEKALAEAAIIMTLKKKYPTLFPESEGDL